MTARTILSIVTVLIDLISPETSPQAIPLASLQKGVKGAHMGVRRMSTIIPPIPPARPPIRPPNMMEAVHITVFPKWAKPPKGRGIANVVVMAINALKTTTSEMSRVSNVRSLRLIA